MPTDSVRSVLTVSHLAKSVQTVDGPLTILHDISFSVEEGESLAIVGASGSGKSTLLGLLAGLDTPTSGHVHLMDQDISAANEDQRAQIRSQHVGFVFQSFQLIDQLSALENVQLPLELKGMPRHEAAAKAQVWLEKVGLGERLNHRPKTLSGGEQQRVALARAFVTQPDVLFADEPTGSLDEVTGQKVIDLLFSLNKDSGSTLILVTHDLALAQRCQRQMVINAGKIVTH
ncbi:ABC transporter ATP-binding protein [Polynucleobacter sp. 30F-ANTBAC]|jgi:putative ABC transport system ATP-binding protein|uniref:ABC transporter ATP-binding protein n=1 Tax=Polynucleobacter sp. 30F-ANTBAC TaxID=2689095 RepID=UPI001C0C297A|nr:ABC transporter ATP-binding protein [Polynucleobacter sp. 30F-ANTBAC]MBU3599080.1 ABC transporter ATP-binding protein [Polynucleobacter sp. 30F-ANTBAC]